MLRRVFQRLRQVIDKSMASVLETGKKRAADEVGGDISKKQKGEQNAPRADRKRKVALLIAYNGKGYYGLQMNPGMASIEGEILKALLAAEVIPQEHFDHPQKMSFQRAARTDKGVSAAGNLLSLKINENLPPQIRVFECVRTTNAFNCKNHCSARTYIYILPTYAFAPVEEICTLEYRTNLDIIEKVNEVLEKFVGTRNFHNFTSGIKPDEGCAKRYIKRFECGMPFVHNGVEFCVLSVMGQSFMMHQIRKMVGLTIAIVRGFANMEAMDHAWKHEKMDIPKAPGLGLMLDKLHYDVYNRKWASDGIHAKIDFKHLKEKLDKFKEEYIFTEIMKEEIETQSMMQWLSKMHYHSCSPVSNKWADRRSINKKLSGELSDGSDKGDQSELSTEQTQATSLDNVALETGNNEQVNKTDLELCATTENISGSSNETVSDNQNKTTDGMTSSQVDCASVNVDKVLDKDVKDKDQSNENSDMKAGSSG